MTDAESFTKRWLKMTENIPLPTIMAGVPIEDWGVTEEGLKVKKKDNVPVKPSFHSEENAKLMKGLLDAGNPFEAVSTGDKKTIEMYDEAMKHLKEYWDVPVKP